MEHDLAAMRRTYALAGLDETQAGDDPLALFSRWLGEAVAAGLDEPNAMTVATADADGNPDARILLLKDFGPQGFAFFTNRRSRKGTQLAARPRAALVFHWSELERQVRVRGSVEEVSRAETERYYAVRPLGSRIGAWASPQSQPVADRAALDAAFAAASAKWGEQPAAPPHWGGYRVLPEEIEFWQGRPSRLHDRLLFTKAGDRWTRTRLAP